MPIEVKVCGLTDAAAVQAAVEGGARYFGFVFYPPSPRALRADEAAALAAAIPEDRAKVGVFVDPSDALLAATLAEVPLDHVQLHGRETPRRIMRIKARFGCKVIKVIKVARAADLGSLVDFLPIADLILFDAKVRQQPGRLPGGNAVSFDWRLLQGLDLPRPWLLAGGLSVDNLEEAVRLSGAPGVDVSSGVEIRPGQKDPVAIRRFLDLAARLEPAPAPAA